MSQRPHACRCPKAPRELPPLNKKMQPHSCCLQGARGLGISKRAVLNVLGVGSVSDYVVHHSQ